MNTFKIPTTTKDAQVAAVIADLLEALTPNGQVKICWDVPPEKEAWIVVTNQLPSAEPLEQRLFVLEDLSNRKDRGLHDIIDWFLEMRWR